MIFENHFLSHGPSVILLHQWICFALLCWSFGSNLTAETNERCSAFFRLLPSCRDLEFYSNFRCVQNRPFLSRNQLILSHKRCWVIPGIHRYITHNSGSIFIYISQMLYTNFHLSPMNHLLCVWKCLFFFGRIPDFAVFCLQVQMCELFQGRGSSVLESLAVETLTKLFFYVNVAADICSTKIKWNPHARCTVF